MSPRPLTDRAVSSRIVYAVADCEGHIDANRIFMLQHMEHALDMARALTTETEVLHLVIPIVLK